MADKRENSVLFSLRELRQIEENRVQEEEQAVRSAEEARVRAREDAERKRREEEEAKARAEHEARVALEQAREAAEREARLRVESAEAAERARQQAALEQNRLQQEMELRRAEVAKKRPTWMLAVTGIALLAAVGLVFFAVQRMNESAEAKKNEEISRREADEAIKEAKAAADRLAQIEGDLADIKKNEDKANALLAAAQDEAGRQAARDQLAKLARQRAEAEQRARDAKAAAFKAERKKGVKIKQECLDNPLAKGCS